MCVSDPACGAVVFFAFICVFMHCSNVSLFLLSEKNENGKERKRTERREKERQERKAREKGKRERIEREREIKEKELAQHMS